MHICRILLLSHKVHCLLPNKLWICSYLSNIFTLEFPLRCPFGGFVFRSKWRGVLSRLYHWSEKKAQKKDGVLFLWIHWIKKARDFYKPHHWTRNWSRDENRRHHPSLISRVSFKIKILFVNLLLFCLWCFDNLISHEI